MAIEQAKTRHTTYVIEHPEHPGERLLVLEYESDCPMCGQISVQFAGHHLRGLLKAAATAVADYPELCGTDEGIHLLERLRFAGASNNPATS